MVIDTPSLLITDDDTAFRDTLRGVFELQGFRTLVAGDGEEALQIIRFEVVHLVLLDMHMPKLTGLETLRRLKQLHEAIPCILMSADLDDLIIEQAEQAHAFSVLRKPVSRNQLTGEVCQALERTYNWHAAGRQPRRRF